MEFLSMFFVAIIGLIFGSFLNVFILRYGTGRGFGGRSKCFSCAHILSFLDLIPLFSFIFLHGKCRYCKSKISLQYVFVEILTSFIFILTFFNFLGRSYEKDIFAILSIFIIPLLFFTLFLAVSVYDFRHKIIPEGMIWGLFVFSLVRFLVTDNFLNILVWFGGGIILALPFFLIWYFSGGRMMGFADWKIAFIIGLFFGLEQGLTSIILAFYIGAVYSIVLLSMRKVGPKSEVPFGPFLALSSFIVFLFDLSLRSIMFSVF